MKLKRKSKTLWLNGVVVLTLGLIELGAQVFAMHIPQIVFAGLIFVSGAGNMILRFFTSEPIR